MLKFLEMVESTSTKSTENHFEAPKILRSILKLRMIPQSWYPKGTLHKRRFVDCRFRDATLGKLAKEFFFKIMPLRINSTCKPRNKLPKHEDICHLYLVKPPVLTSNISCHFTQLPQMDPLKHYDVIVEPSLKLSLWQLDSLVLRKWSGQFTINLYSNLNVLAILGRIPLMP